MVRNCPDRWDPPDPRPDRFRELLGIPGPRPAIVLYQGLLMGDRGIEQAMDAILEVPDAVLVLMGFGNQNGDQSTRDPFAEESQRSPYPGKVHLIDPVPPTELLPWSASADIMVMTVQPRCENHRYVTPQKLWEAIAAGVPVVASDLPGFRAVVTETGCGELWTPRSRRPSRRPSDVCSTGGRRMAGGGRPGPRLPTTATTGRSRRRSSRASTPACWRVGGPDDRDPRRTPWGTRAAAPARIGILSPGTSEFDSRAHRIARSLVARGDSVTIYSRRRPRPASGGGDRRYRVVRMPLSASMSG